MKQYKDYERTKYADELRSLALKNQDTLSFPQKKKDHPAAGGSFIFRLILSLLFFLLYLFAERSGNSFLQQGKEMFDSLIEKNGIIH